MALENNELNLPIIGKRVAMCIIDFAFSLKFIKGPIDLTLRIECAFMLTFGNNQTIILDPEQTMELTPALGLLHKTVQTAIAEESGQLRVEFSDGYSIEVAPNDQVEAWNLSGHDGLLIVCLPGGGIAKWKSISQ